MPLYDFVCDNCGNKFEDLVKENEKPACPRCQSVNVSKKVSCCARYKGTSDSSASAPSMPATGGCGGCMGGNCGSCGR